MSLRAEVADYPSHSQTIKNSPRAHLYMNKGIRSLLPVQDNLCRNGTHETSHSVSRHISDIGHSRRHKVLMNFVADTVNRRKQCTENHQQHGTFPDSCQLKHAEKKICEQCISTGMRQLVHMGNRGKAVGCRIGRLDKDQKAVQNHRQPIENEYFAMGV